MRDALTAGLDAGGATIDDFRHPDGVTGAFQHEFLVHRREGEPCPVCGTTIVKLVAGGRGTYVCERCQPQAAGRRRRLLEQLGRRPDWSAVHSLLEAADELAADDDLGEAHHPGPLRPAPRGRPGPLPD